MAFSPDGRTLAVGDENGNVTLWNTSTRRRAGALAEGSIVLSVAFSPDGRTLAVGDQNGNVTLWNTSTRRRAGALAEGGIVNSVAFNPDGRTLAVGDQNGNVTLWDAATRRRSATLAEGGTDVIAGFSPDGRTLAISLNDNVEFLQQVFWILPGKSIESIVCGEVRRNMTQAQWTANAPGQPYQKTCPTYP